MNLQIPKYTVSVCDICHQANVLEKHRQSSGEGGLNPFLNICAIFMSQLFFGCPPLTPPSNIHKHKHKIICFSLIFFFLFLAQLCKQIPLVRQHSYSWGLFLFLVSINCTVVINIITCCVFVFFFLRYHCGLILTEVWVRFQL